MKRTSLALFVGAICLAISGQWLLHAQLSSNNPLVQNPNMVDRPRTVQRNQMLEEMANQSITWTKPTGPEPKWLARGRKRFQSIERIRDLLAREIEPQDLQGIPLATVLGRLSSLLEIPIHFNAAKIASETSISEETPITLQFTGNLRTCLDVLLGPYELTYVINEAGLEVTTLADASTKPSIGVYDLSFVAADSENAKSILQAIGLTINTQGVLDMFMVGQMLVVSATERAHVEIESVLARLAPSPSIPAPSTPAESAPESGNKMAPNDKKSEIDDPFGRSNPVGEDPFGS
ncbi:MAG: hypothetical protein ACK5PB_10690 [Pirellula sp.]|jgi:hypothetical protein